LIRKGDRTVAPLLPNSENFKTFPNVHSSSSIITMIKLRRIGWAGHVTRIGEKSNVYRSLVGRPEGKRSLGRPRRRLEDSIKMDIRDTVWNGMDWIDLAQDMDQ
jgi:hypothetical protein